jgi:TonB family protein
MTIDYGGEDSGLGDLTPTPVGRRDAVLARRSVRFRRQLLSAEAALARGDYDRAVQAAEQAGLLDPDDARVLAILDEAQRSRDAAPAGASGKGRPKGAGDPIAPASWLLGTAFAGTPRRTTSTLSVTVSVVGHAVVAAVVIVALIRIVPAVEFTPMALLEFPAALGSSAAPPEVLDPDVPETVEETSEEDIDQPPTIMTTTPLADLYDIQPIRRRAVTSSVAIPSARSRRGRLGVPGGSPFGSGLVQGRSPWQVTEADRPPQLVRAVPPVYPRAAFDQGFEGIVVVVLQVVVNREGIVERTSVVEGLPLLNAAARAAAEQWEYRPALRNGFRVPSVFSVSITFDFR